jgi:hypothetical protein
MPFRHLGRSLPLLLMISEPMRFAALFGILGLLLAGAAARSAVGGGTHWAVAWGTAVAEGYGALCLWTLAAVYGANARGCSLDWAFGGSRRRNGPVIGWLLWPYRRLALATLALWRRFDSMELAHAVGPRLFVGRRPRGADAARLKELGIDSILNLCAEFPGYSGSFDAVGTLETVDLPILDGTAPSARQFHEAVAWITARHGTGGTVLVHCAQGRGRSVTVAAAALCRLGLAVDPEDALSRIRAVRPRARPSRSQRRALDDYWNSVRSGDAEPLSRLNTLEG